MFVEVKCNKFKSTIKIPKTLFFPCQVFNRAIGEPQINFLVTGGLKGKVAVGST
jgi:hypothetical protein